MRICLSKKEKDLGPKCVKDSAAGGDRAANGDRAAAGDQVAVADGSKITEVR